MFIDLTEEIEKENSNFEKGKYRLKKKYRKKWFVYLYQYNLLYELIIVFNESN